MGGESSATNPVIHRKGRQHRIAGMYDVIEWSDLPPVRLPGERDPSKNSKVATDSVAMAKWPKLGRGTYRQRRSGRTALPVSDTPGGFADGVRLALTAQGPLTSTPSSRVTRFQARHRQRCRRVHSRFVPPVPAALGPSSVRIHPGEPTCTTALLTWGTLRAGRIPWSQAWTSNGPP